MEPFREYGMFDIYVKLHVKITELKEIEAFEVIVLGFKYDDFIITTQPEEIKELIKMLPGNKCEINYLFNGKNYEFYSKILSIQNEPAQVMFFSFPVSFKEKSLRRNERHKVLIPITIKKFQLRDGKVREINDPKGKIIDISKDGCLIYTFREFELGSILTIDFFLPDGSFIDNLKACVRSFLRVPLGMHIGVEFDGINQEKKKLFDKFFSKVE